MPLGGVLSLKSTILSQNFRFFRCKLQKIMKHAFRPAPGHFMEETPLKFIQPLYWSRPDKWSSKMKLKNEALDVSFSKMVISGQFKKWSIRGQWRWKIRKSGLNTGVLKNILLWTQACFEKAICFSDIFNFFLIF